MAGSAAAAVYICLQLSNAPRGVTKSLEKTAIRLSWMDPEDLAVTLSLPTISIIHTEINVPKCTE